MEKYILFAGRKIPVATTYNVVLFDSDKAQSFYHPENSLSPADLLQMQTIRPELKTFSFRSNKLTRTGDQLFNVPRAEIDILSNHITQIAFHHDVTFSATKRLTSSASVASQHISTSITTVPSISSSIAITQPGQPVTTTICPSPST